MPRSARGWGHFSVRNCACGAAICAFWSAAGAAAAIGGSFGAPLTGAFYAFELVLGTYSIACAGPIFAASIVGVLFTQLHCRRALSDIDARCRQPLTLADYPASVRSRRLFRRVWHFRHARGRRFPKRRCKRRHVPVWARPVLGGAAVAALATVTPQVLGAGHGALALNIATDFPARAAGGCSCVLKTDRLPDFARHRLSRRPVFRLAVSWAPCLGKIYASSSPRCSPPRARSDHLHPWRGWPRWAS